MKRFFTRNLGWKLLSVALAFLLWLALEREPELATSISVPILFKNIPDDLDINSDLPDHVRLRVRGPSGRLVQENLAQTAVLLDLEGIQPGERTFTIRNREVRALPIGVTFDSAEPSQISLRFEHLAARDVPVQPAYSKPPPDGYRIVSFAIMPAQARIRGPESNIANIDHVTTDPIDLSGVVSSTEKRVHVRVGDPQVRLDSTALVTFKVALSKTPQKDVK
jgi:YbbR domain-containing protein